MPSKRPSKPKEAAPPWQVILEEIRSQNRAVMEGVDARHDEMRRELQSFRGEVRADTSVLRTLLQGHSIDLRDLKTGLAHVETKVDKLETKVGEIDGKVDRLVPLEERVAALERR